MSSARLPGKILRPVAGKPMLQYLLERLEHCDSVGPVILATSKEDSDTPVEAFGQTMGVHVHRGSLNDVASRFCEIARVFSFQAFMRVSGDSPLLDQEIVRKSCTLFETTDCDLATNVFPRTFPPGQSVEILRTASFLDAVERFDAADREHVTTFFYRNSAQYRIANFVSDIDCAGFRTAVDTEEDLKRFSAIVSRMTRPHWEYSLAGLLALYPH